ncbi:MAG: hypothetical protein IJ220_07210 [Clostridia bacterium]|nr:hypothetical protein [Clostridia bacterium]
MKSNKGVTLASLTIYIIVLMIILIVLTFISANFTSRIVEATNRGKVSNECIKIYSFMLNDIKASNKVEEFSDDYVRFDNGVKYSIKYLYALTSGDRQEKQYEIYRNNVLIAENMLDAKFDYDINENVFIVTVKYFYGKSFANKTQRFKVGRGY